jgi:prepilin-type N-terminal cleavage/methylation domain-containing protein
MATGLSARRPRTVHATSAGRDSGFTLVELLVAMSVFAVLMVLMSTVTMSGFSTIRTVMARSDTQARAALAIEEASRLLRYTAIPDGQTMAILSASPTYIKFYTYSGSGPRGDVPYLAELSVVSENGGKALKAKVWAPTSYNGDWSAWTSLVASRTLFSVASTAGSPLLIAVTKCDTKTGCYLSRIAATPVNPAPITLATEDWQPDTVTISVGDQNDPKYVVKQQIGLVNES